MGAFCQDCGSERVDFAGYCGVCPECDGPAIEAEEDREREEREREKYERETREMERRYEEENQ